MTFTVIIPARYASSRLPGKPLADIAGKTMIQRVVEQAQLSKAARVAVAVDDERVQQACEALTDVCMTAVNHESGTDRLHEAAMMLGLADDDIVVNVQGDEPLIPPALIDQVATNLADNEQAGIATLSVPITSHEEFTNPNAVKVVASDSGYALYFSRAPIPWPRDEAEGTMPTAYSAQRHIGIYAYRVSFLKQFVTWPASDLEQTEKLEQLRAMSHDVKIHVAEAAQVPPPGVDTPEDLARVIAVVEGGYDG